MMITQIFTHLGNRAIMISCFMIFFSLVGFSQAPVITGHDCSCQDDTGTQYPTGVMQFEICVEGLLGDEIIISDGPQFFADEDLSVPLTPSSIVVTTANETADGIYCFEGFAGAVVGTIPTITVTMDGVSQVFKAFSCQLPQATATITGLGDADKFCTGKDVCVNVVIEVIDPSTDEFGPALIQPTEFDWTAPGSNRPSVVAGSASECFGYDLNGNSVITVSGIDNENCPFATQLTIEMVDLTSGVIISGATEIFNCLENTATYTATVPDCVTPSWSIAGATTSNETFDAVTGITTVDVTFGAPGTFLLELNDASGSMCDFSDVELEIVVKDEIDNVAINGALIVCEGETASYVVDNPTSYTDVNWAIMPTTVGTCTPTLAPANPTDAVDITFPADCAGNTFTLEMTAQTTPDGCDVRSSIEIVVIDDEFEQLACNNKVNVTLDNNCELMLLPEMILEGEIQGNDAYTVEITDQNGNEISNPITSDLVNSTLIVTVRQRCGANSCWGELLVEDKSVTPLSCPDAVNILCTEVDDKSVFEDIPGLPFSAADIAAGTITAIDNPNGDGWIVSGHDNCSDVLLECSDGDGADSCDPMQVIQRTWKVTDLVNNAMSSCIVDLNVSNLLFSDITPPKNFDTQLDPNPMDDDDGHCSSIDACLLIVGDDVPGLLCDEYKEDFNGNPHPDCTGWPTGLLCGNLTFAVPPYQDNEIPICGKSKKILRNWKVINHCDGSVWTHTQFITLKEGSDGITCNVPFETVALTDTHECGADIILGDPSVFGTCSDWTYSVKWKPTRGDLADGCNAIGFSAFPFADADLAEGEDAVLRDVAFETDSIWVYYLVTDACGNSAECCTEIRLEDDEPPIPACDLNNVVTLNEDGLAYVTPATFDDESWDNCGVHQTVVRRMDGDGCGCDERKFDFMHYLGEFGGHYYYLSKDRTDGRKALAKAEALSTIDTKDGYAAVIDSAAENSWLRDRVDLYTNRPVFIGLTGSYDLIDEEFDLSWVNDSAYVYNAPLSGDDFDEGPEEFVYTVLNNDGSWDAEGLGVQLEAYVVEFETKCGFTELIKFCCDDVAADETMVQMRVIDKFGNHNFCMVNVSVSENMAPNIECPEDVLLDCTVEFDIDTLGMAVASDACGIETPEITVQESPFDCGNQTIVRRFVATDGSGNTSACQQRIFVRNLAPFNRDSITWPQDTTIFDICELEGYDPDLLAPGFDRPTWNASSCSNIISSFDDLVFYIVDGACQKMVRTWSVVDWCDPDKTVYTNTQVIKLMNTVDPSINCASGTEVFAADNCSINIDDILASINPNGACTSTVKWSHTIDFDNNGTDDVTSGETILNGDSEYSVSGNFTVGTHSISYQVEDICENTGTCTKTIRVTDNTVPRPYCLGELVVPLNTIAGNEIWANDVDFGSDDLCTEVTLSFEENRLETSLLFDCDNLGDNLVTLWVWDSPNPNSANKSSCTVNINVQDNAGVCGGDTTALRAILAGNVRREDAQMVDEVEINLTSVDLNSDINEMAVTGEYAFANVPMYNNYAISAEKNDEYLNGISTLDLILIQRHILGLELLDSPYKIIAADVNNSQTIDGIDLVELRKLILGIYLELPQNASWRFVDAHHQFADPYNPFPFEERVMVEGLEESIYDADFVGAKIGDVNLSAEMSFNSNPLVGRSDNKFSVLLETEETDKGNTLIKLVSQEDGDFYGAQFNYNIEGSELITTVPGILGISEDNVAWDALEEGRLKLSWNTTEGISIRKGDVLIEFLFEGSNDVNLSETSGINTEVYTDAEGQISAQLIDYLVQNDNGDGFRLLQNIPNPFKDVTTIGFYLPQESTVDLTITDVEGKLVYRSSAIYAAGKNEVIISSEDLNVSGILYYQLTTGNQTSTKKMIVLK